MKSLPRTPAGPPLRSQMKVHVLHTLPHFAEQDYSFGEPASPCLAFSYKGHVQASLVSQLHTKGSHNQDTQSQGLCLHSSQSMSSHTRNDQHMQDLLAGRTSSSQQHVLAAVSTHKAMDALA